MGELLYNVGIEIEFEGVTQDDLQQALNKQERSIAHVAHDASSETPIRLDSRTGMRVENKSKLKINSQVNGVAGGELVSSVWFNKNPDIILGDINKLTTLLSDLGEEHRSKRAGIHFHISYSYNIQVLKTLLLVGSHLENMFYCLGGFGYENRATLNDAIYFRPITRKGPCVVPTRSGFSQVFTKEALLKAENSQEFFLRYGDSHNVSSRYSPVRYSWLNFFNLNKNTGTLEFRVFNTTLNPLYIWAALQFCVEFSRFCLTAKPEYLEETGLLVENSVFEEQGKDKILETAENFFAVADIPDKIQNLITNILMVSPEVTLSENLVFSHLYSKGNCATHWSNREFFPTELDKDDVENPNFDDVHSLRRL